MRVLCQITILLLFPVFIFSQSEVQVKAIEFYNEGVISMKEKEYDDAKHFFSKAIELDNNFPKPYYQRALANMYSKDFKGAAIDFKKSTSFEDYKVKAQYYLGYSQVQLKDYERAIINLREAKTLDPDNEKIYYYLGYIDFIQKDYEGAMELFQSAIDKGYESEKVWYYKGMAHYKTNDIASAIPCFEKQMAINPDAEKTSLTLLNLHQKLENYEEVVSYANSYLSSHPEDVEVMNMKATGLLKMESYSLAQKTYDAILDIEPSNTTALKNNLFIAQKTDDKERMIIDLSRLVKAEGPSSEYLFKRATVLVGLERIDDALKDLDVVIEQNPEHNKAYYYRAILHGKKQENEKACEDIRMAAQLGYEEAFQYVRSYCPN